MNGPYLAYLPVHTSDSKEQLDEMANFEDSAEPIRNNYKQNNVDGRGEGWRERVSEREMEERK